MRNRNSRTVSALVLALAALLVMAGFTCHRRSRASIARVAFEEAIMQRQISGMHDLIATMRDSSLIPADQALVIVDQGLVRNLLRAAIPYERDLGNGITVKVDSATVVFEDGLALIQLEGRARLGAGENVYADVTVYGDLNTVELDPQEGLLRGKVDVIAFDERKVNMMGLAPSVKQLMQDLKDLGIADLAPLNYTIEIPVRLASVVKLPAIGNPGSDVHIREATIPIDVSVASVKSFRGKLWITLNVAVPGAEQRGTAAPKTRQPHKAPEGAPGEPAGSAGA